VGANWREILAKRGSGSTPLNFGNELAQVECLHAGTLLQRNALLAWGFRLRRRVPVARRRAPHWSGESSRFQDTAGKHQEAQKSTTTGTSRISQNSYSKSDSLTIDKYSELMLALLLHAYFTIFS